MSDLCYISADDALAAFRAKTLSPVELMQAVMDQSEKTADTINAHSFTFFDRAMEQARTAEARYASGTATGALEGLPVGIKDESYVAGQPTTNGSLILKDFVPEETTAVNARILAEGAIVHARTTTPEFSCAGFTWSRLWGVTRNPWNPAFTPGGSSGGSSASLASGTSTLCTGSDIGGSIRIPASTCGLVGYKPPYGRNPDDTPLNLDFYCHTGPLGRTVKDVIRLQNIMCGPHPHDIATLRPKLVLPDTYQPIKDWKIAYSPDLGCFEVDPEVERNTLAALDVFRSLGATVEQVDLGWGAEIMTNALAYLEHIFGAVLAEDLAEHGDDMTTYARDFATKGQASTPARFVRSLEVAGEMYKTLGPILERFNVLICPTTALPSIPADFDPTRDTVEINGKQVDPFLGWVMTTPFNTMSRCPVLSVPSGFAANGVPTGIQIVGRTYCDQDVFQAALAYETALGGWFSSAADRPAI